jgi:hypothetical protein
MTTFEMQKGTEIIYNNIINQMQLIKKNKMLRDRRNLLLAEARKIQKKVRTHFIGKIVIAATYIYSKA